MEIRPIFSALLRSKTAPLLVAIQIAISLAILANALYVVSLRQQAAVRPSGIAHEENVFRVSSAPINKLTHIDMLAQQQRDMAALKAIPGVVSVAWTNQMPMTRSGSTSGIALDSKQVKSTTDVSMYLGPNSLVDTLELKLVEGRDFNASDIVEMDADKDDGTTFAHTVIVTQELANKLYPGAAGVVGKTFYLGTGKDANALQIVGVVERLQSHGANPGLRGEIAMAVPLRISFSASLYAVRTEPGQRDRVMAQAETVLRKASPVPTITRVRSVEQDRTARYRTEKTLAWMLITVSVLLLLVTASGIVGMSTLRVTQRRKQIGMRRAMGARRRDILRYFIAENFMITSAGVLTGCLLAFGLNQLLVSQLEMSKLPMAYLLYGAGTFWVLGALAVYGPAYRAASISPATATRSV